MEKEVCYDFVIRGQARPTLLPSLRHAPAQPLSRLQCHARRLRRMRCILPTVCAVCGLPITSTWYTFEELLPTGAPRKFCPRCVQGRPRCDLCRAPVGDGAQPLADGQYRCALCLSEIVLEVADVLTVYHQAIAQVARVLRGQLRQTPRMEIVSRRKMGEIRRRYE